jgi:hypothetical protein
MVRRERDHRADRRRAGIAGELALAAGLTAWLGKYGFSFAVPPGGLVAIACRRSGRHGRTASARRAARVNVLDALAFE